MYIRYFINGTRNGKGELDFVKKKQKKVKVKNVKVESELDAELTTKAKLEKFLAKNKEKIDASATEDIKAKERKLKELAARIPEFKYRYQGYFIANNITGGGIVMDTIYQTPRSVAKRDKR